MFKYSLSYLVFVFVSLFAVARADDLAEQHRLPPEDEFSKTQRFGKDLPSKHLALTFDDGPGERTPELGTYLFKRGIRATFFMQGSNVPGHEQVLQTLKEQGHLVANHSYSHKKMTKLGVDEAISEVKKADDLILPYVTDDIFLFRAPYGDWAPRLADILNNTDLVKYVGGIFWDIGGVTTSRYSADWDCWRRGDSISWCGLGYLNEIHDKDHGIVLMHDVHSKTIDMVYWMIPRLENQGYTFARVDEVPNIAEALGQK